MAEKFPSSFGVALVLALSSALYVTPACAQSAQPPARRATYGLQAGVNFATLGGDSVENAKTRTGFVAGVYADWPMSNGFSFHPSVLYSMEGAKESDSQADVTLKQDYIRVPAMLRYTWPMAGTSHPFVAVGPSFGYQVKCEISGSSNGISASASCDAFTEPGGSQRKKFDVSGRVEAGIDFAMSGRKLTLGGAYSYGFTDVVNNESAKNRVISVFLGFGV